MNDSDATMDDVFIVCRRVKLLTAQMNMSVQSMLTIHIINDKSRFVFGLPNQPIPPSPVLILNPMENMLLRQWKWY